MIVMCGDFTINYLAENDMTKQLDVMLISYNLTSSVDFPTSIQNKSSTAIDTTFINILHYSNFLIIPQVNGLSNFVAQLLTINEINLAKQTCHTKTNQDINKNSIIEFQIKLSYVLWDNIFNSDNGNDVDTLFNSFLNSYLKIFYSNFPIKKFNKKTNKKPWIIEKLKLCVNIHKIYIS